MSRPARALLLGALFGPASAAAASCPTLDEAAASLRAAAVPGPAAAAPQAAAEAALACASSLEAGPLAALFDAQAAFFTALDAPDEAELARASATRLRSGGPEAVATDPPPGSLRLAPGGPRVQLNGAAAVADQPLQAGFYAVVIDGPAGRTAQLHALWPGEDLHISAAGVVEARTRPAPAAPTATAAVVLSAPPPLPDPAPAPLPSAPQVRGPAPGRPWFIAAGGAAAAAAVTASIARAQIGAAAGATAQGDIDRARQVQLATGISSYTLMATTGGLVVVGLRR